MDGGSFGCGAVGIAAILGMAAVMIVGIVFDARKKPVPEGPAAEGPSRLSGLAAGSFLFGLLALLLVVGAIIASVCGRCGDLFGFSSGDYRPLRLTERILLYCSLGPAVGALAFWLGARGVVLGSHGAVRGRALYRSGVILAVGTAFLALSGTSSLAERLETQLSRAIKAGLKAPASPEPEPGYLGVEVEQIHVTPDAGPARHLCRVKLVVPGSPAERSGLRVGDVILKIDSEVADSFARQIASRKPGTVVGLLVERELETLSVSVTLGVPPLKSLLTLLRKQSFDDERILVLRPACGHRRFSTAELVEVLGTFTFDKGRMDAIRLAFPTLTDPENSYQLLDVFTFSDAKETMSGWLQQQKR